MFVDPFLVNGVVKRVDMDAIHAAKIARSPCLEVFEVIHVDEQISASGPPQDRFRAQSNNQVGTFRW